MFWLLLFLLIGLLFIARFMAVPLFSPMPDNLGVINGQLAACPGTPNCYTSSTDEGGVAPIAYEMSVEDARQRVLDIINGMERSEVITADDTYIHAEFTSQWWGFIDDTEFYFDDENKVIHFRSAARLGQSDMGVNQARIESIVQQFRSE